MTSLGGEAIALGTACAAWVVAARAAHARSVTLGNPPLPALGALVAAAAVPAPADAARFIILGGVAVAAICDARTGLIFTPLATGVGAAALGAALVEGSVTAAATGALAVGSGLFALYAATRGRGIGLGDVRLGCAVGAGLGAAPGFVALGWAFALGGLYGGLLLATRRARRGTEIRFAPFIAAGTLAALVPSIVR